jgi:hypothetical protein
VGRFYNLPLTRLEGIYIDSLYACLHGWIIKVSSLFARSAMHAVHVFAYIHKYITIQNAMQYLLRKKVAIA